MDAAEQWEEKGTVVVDFEALLCRVIERWKMIVCFIVIGALLAGFYCICLAVPQYESTSKIYIKSRGSSVVDLSALQIGSYLTSDYQEMFFSWEVQEKVIQNLGLEYTYEDLSEMVEISNPTDTRLLYITATSKDPQEAMNIANEFASVAAEYISEIMSVEKPSVVSAATLPEKPKSPRKKLDIALGMICGLLVALIVIIVQFLQDDKIKTATDLQKLNVTTLVVVPSNDVEYSRGRYRAND